MFSTSPPATHSVLAGRAILVYGFPERHKASLCELVVKHGGRVHPHPNDSTYAAIFPFDDVKRGVDCVLQSCNLEIPILDEAFLLYIDQNGHIPDFDDYNLLDKFQDRYAEASKYPGAKKLSSMIRREKDAHLSASPISLSIEYPFDDQSPPRSRGWGNKINHKRRNTVANVARITMPKRSARSSVPSSPPLVPTSPPTTSRGSPASSSAATGKALRLGNSSTLSSRSNATSSSSPSRNRSSSSRAAEAHMELFHFDEDVDQWEDIQLRQRSVTSLQTLTSTSSASFSTAPATPTTMRLGSTTLGMGTPTSSHNNDTDSVFTPSTPAVLLATTTTTTTTSEPNSELTTRSNSTTTSPPPPDEVTPPPPARGPPVPLAPFSLGSAVIAAASNMPSTPSPTTMQLGTQMVQTPAIKSDDHLESLNEFTAHCVDWIDRMFHKRQQLNDGANSRRGSQAQQDLHRLPSAIANLMRIQTGNQILPAPLEASVIDRKRRDARVVVDSILNFASSPVSLDNVTRAHTVLEALDDAESLYPRAVKESDGTLKYIKLRDDHLPSETERRCYDRNVDALMTYANTTRSLRDAYQTILTLWHVAKVDIPCCDEPSLLAKRLLARKLNPIAPCVIRYDARTDDSAVFVQNGLKRYSVTGLVDLVLHRIYKRKHKDEKPSSSVFKIVDLPDDDAKSAPVFKAIELLTHHSHVNFFHKLGLPSFQPLALYLTRVPIAILLQCLQLRLLSIPKILSVQSSNQLANEFHELIAQSVRVKSVYLHMMIGLSAREPSDDEWKEQVFDVFEQNLKCALEQHLRLLYEWLRQVQSLQYPPTRNFVDVLENRWEELLKFASHILDGEAQCARQFCLMVSSITANVQHVLESRMASLRQRDAEFEAQVSNIDVGADVEVDDDDEEEEEEDDDDGNNNVGVMVEEELTRSNGISIPNATHRITTSTHSPTTTVPQLSVSPPTRPFFDLPTLSNTTEPLVPRTGPDPEALVSPESSLNSKRQPLNYLAPRIVPQRSRSLAHVKISPSSTSASAAAAENAAREATATASTSTTAAATSNSPSDSPVLRHRKTHSFGSRSMSTGKASQKASVALLLVGIGSNAIATPSSNLNPNSNVATTSTPLSINTNSNSNNNNSNNNANHPSRTLSPQGSIQHHSSTDSVGGAGGASLPETPSTLASGSVAFGSIETVDFELPKLQQQRQQLPISLSPPPVPHTSNDDRSDSLVSQVGDDEDMTSNVLQFERDARELFDEIRRSSQRTLRFSKKLLRSLEVAVDFRMVAKIRTVLKVLRSNGFAMLVDTNEMPLDPSVVLFASPAFVASDHKRACLAQLLRCCRGEQGNFDADHIYLIAVDAQNTPSKIADEAAQVDSLVVRDWTRHKGRLMTLERQVDIALVLSDMDLSDPNPPSDIHETSSSVSRQEILKVIACSSTHLQECKATFVQMVGRGIVERQSLRQCSPLHSVQSNLRSLFVGTRRLLLEVMESVQQLYLMMQAERYTETDAETTRCQHVLQLAFNVAFEFYPQALKIISADNELVTECVRLLTSWARFVTHMCPGQHKIVPKWAMAGLQLIRDNKPTHLVQLDHSVTEEYRSNVRLLMLHLVSDLPFDPLMRHSVSTSITQSAYSLVSHQSLGSLQLGEGANRPSSAVVAGSHHPLSGLAHKEREHESAAHQPSSTLQQQLQHQRSLASATHSVPHSPPQSRHATAFSSVASGTTALSTKGSVTPPALMRRSQTTTFGTSTRDSSSSVVSMDLKDLPAGMLEEGTIATGTAANGGASTAPGSILSRRKQPVRRTASRLEVLKELDLARDDRLRKVSVIGKEVSRPTRAGNLMSEEELRMLAPYLQKVRYQRGRLLGQGSSGVVHACVDLDKGQPVAIKFINLNHPERAARIRSIQLELSVLTVLHHPNLVTYYGCEVNGDELCLIMECCNGGTLTKMLESGPIDHESLACTLSQHLVQVVNHLHNEGVAHRDIKSDNIFFDDEGKLKLGDFGSCHKLKKETTLHGEMPDLAGTPAYMAPEVITREKRIGHGRSADIWSIGCVVYEMVTGRPPWSQFHGPEAIIFQIATSPPPTPPTTLSENGRDFISQCLTVDPDERPSAGELLHHRWFASL